MNFPQKFNSTVGYLIPAVQYHTPHVVQTYEVVIVHLVALLLGQQLLLLGVHRLEKTLETPLEKNVG